MPIRSSIEEVVEARGVTRKIELSERRVFVLVNRCADLPGALGEVEPIAIDDNAVGKIDGVERVI